MVASGVVFFASASAENNMKAIALSEVPEIYRLLKEGEELSDLQR